MDIENLLKLLKERNARFVIIGATAFPVYGYTRATIDVDLFIKATRTNAQKIFDALQEFGYDVSDISIDDLLSKKILIREYLLETDVHPFVAGIEFDDVWENKVEEKLGETPVYFASLDDLIKMKEAAARPKDQEDLKALRKIKARLNEQN